MSSNPMSKKPTASAPASDAQTKPFLDEWKSLTDWLETAKAREIELRNYLAKLFFPTPVEGVNRIVTADGFEFVLEYKINRKLDEPALDSVMQQLPEDSPFRQLGVLVAYKPTLVIKGLRAMPEDQKLIFSQALTETPGTPSLVVNIITPESEAASDPSTAPATPDWPAAGTPREPSASGFPSVEPGEEAPAPSPAKKTRKSSKKK